MTISAGFLWRFLDDVWDLLPPQDRTLFETYWSAQIQIAANFQNKALEASLSNSVIDVPVLLTDRWERFVMDEVSCDLFGATDSITLVGDTPTALSRATALYHTLSVGSSTAQILYSESLVFSDDSPHKLRYGKVIAGTLSVRIGSAQYTENRDYSVNHVDGIVSALDGGRLPIDQVATIHYAHSEYAAGLDYDVNQPNGTIARSHGSTIVSGTQVAARYTYNNTATLPLSSTGGAVLVDLVTLRDTTQDFSGLLPGRTLTVTSGLNTGTYTVDAVVSQTDLRITTNFVQAQVGDVVYLINAFPHGIKVNSRIASVPTLQNTITDPTRVFVEGVDFIVANGILSARQAFQMPTIGHLDDRVPTMWAEKTKIDGETPYRNFGVLIDFYRKNSEAYKLALQGLWYAFWTGSTPNNIRRGLHILLGLPFVRQAGVVTVATAPTSSTTGDVRVTDARGRHVTYSIPSGLTLEDGVILGARLDRFSALSTGVKVIDRNNEPGFVKTRLGRAGIQRFLTTNASRGVAASTDESKSLELLEHHLFLPQILVDAVTRRIDVTELTQFLNNIKPQWTEYLLSFNDDASDSLNLMEEASYAWAIDLTTTIGNNEGGLAWHRNNFLVSRSTGKILGDGSSTAGNFQDPMVDFSALGIGRGDYVRIATGDYSGYHKVLAIIGTNILALDIPGVTSPDHALEYVILQKEHGLGHDAVNLRLEHVLLSGTGYSEPTGMSIRTDATLAGLENKDLRSLMLVDVGMLGMEIQDIIDADVATGELWINTVPPMVARHHEIASAALKRIDGTTSTVTHAFAI